MREGGSAALGDIVSGAPEGVSAALPFSAPLVAFSSSHNFFSICFLCVVTYVSHPLLSPHQRLESKKGIRTMAAASKRTRSRVKVVTQVPQLDAELQKASDRLVVLEFFSEK